MSARVEQPAAFENLRCPTCKGEGYHLSDLEPADEYNETPFQHHLPCDNCMTTGSAIYAKESEALEIMRGQYRELEEYCELLRGRLAGCDC